MVSLLVPTGFSLFLGIFKLNEWAQIITAKADDLMIAIVGQCAAYTQGIIYFWNPDKVEIYLEKSGCRIRPGQIIATSPDLTPKGS